MTTKRPGGSVPIGREPVPDLPGGLPPGQWISPNPEFAGGEPVAGPSLWITDDPVPDAARLWARLLREHPRSGLWPLLLLTMRRRGERLAKSMPMAEAEAGEQLIRRLARRPWHAGELAPVPLSAVDAQDAGEILARWWDQITPPQSFERWPGLAPASPRGIDPDEHAAALAESPGGLKQLTGRNDGVHVGLVPATDGAAALASCGWLSRRGRVEEDAAVIRSWQDRFGARLCTLGIDIVVLSVAWPPAPEHRLRTAAELLAYETDDALHAGGTSITFEDYAADVSESHVWGFWWD